MRKTLAALFVAVSVLASASAGFSEPVVYKHKFIKGALGKYKIKTVMKMSDPQDGKSVNATLELTLLQRPTEVSKDGMALVKNTITDLKYSSAAGGSKFKGKNSSVTMFVAQDGRRSGIDGFSSNGDNPFEAAYTIGEEIVFPAKPISVGDSWDTVVQIPGYPTDMHVTSTLVSDSETIWGQKASKIKQVYSAQIDIAKLMKQLAADKGKTAMFPMDMSGTMDLSGTTECLFSQSKGILLTSVSQQKTDVKMTISMGKEGKAQPVEYVMENTITTTRFK